MKYFSIIFLLLAIGFCFFTLESTEKRSDLDQYIQKRIDETAKEMNYLMTIENYEEHPRWIYLKGKFDAFYEVLYDFEC